MHYRYWLKRADQSFTFPFWMTTRAGPCCIKKCKVTEVSCYPCASAQFETDEKKKCPKQIHILCFERMLEDQAITPVENEEDGSNYVVCGKRCLNRVKKYFVDKNTPKSKRSLWSNDGPTDEVSSMKILLDWITTEGNYSLYRGDTQSGKTKSSIAADIVRLMESKGIPQGLRSPKDVMTKILTLENEFRLATDFRNNTGSGIENEDSLKEAILTRCRFYDELEPVMADRVSNKPLYLNGEESNAGRLDMREDINSNAETDVALPTRPDSPRSASSSIASSAGRLGTICTKRKKRKAEEQRQSEVQLMLDIQRYKMAMDNRRYAAEIEQAKQRYELDAKRHTIEEERACLEKRRAELELANLEMENKKQLLLNRLQLQKAGVDAAEIEMLLPLQNYPPNAMDS